MSKMKTAKFLLCLVAIAISSVIGSPVNDGRIANGMTITIKEAPYMVRLIHNSGFSCGGSLVSPDYVVTAAHCVHGKSRNGFTVIANITSINETGIRRKVSILSVHPEYNPADRHSDVGVLQLKEPIADILTLELCKQSLKEGDTIQVSGWGRLGEDKPASSILQTVYLPVRSQETCANEHHRFVKKNMFCASGLEDKSSCKGDSGGPAVYKGQLCGLVAFGYSCDLVGRPEVYTDVYAVKPFIENIMSLGSNFAYRNYQLFMYLSV